MERSVALRRLRNMLGKEFAYEFKPDAPTAEERALARQRAPELLATKERLSKEMADRREAILAADAKYQQLLLAFKEADAAHRKNNEPLFFYKITVGTLNKLFFHVSAQGDSWEDIFKQLAKRKTSNASS